MRFCKVDYIVIIVLLSLYAQNSFAGKIHRAVEKGDYAKVESLVIKDSSLISKRGSASRTPLHISAKEGKLNISRLLINHGADVNAKDYYGYNPLHLSASEEHIDVCNLLIENEANINAKNINGYTPLHVAAGSGNMKVCVLLINHGADVGARTRYYDKSVVGEQNYFNSYTPLHLAARYGNSEVCKLLISKGSNVNAEDGDRWTPIHITSMFGDLATTKVLVENGAITTNYNYNYKNSTPYEIAVKNGHDDLASFLQENHPDKLRQNRINSIHNAIEIGDHQKIRSILEEHPKTIVPIDPSPVKLEDEDGWLPLHHAVIKGNKEIIDLLLSSGAFVNDKSNGYTALHLAIKNGNEDLAIFLIGKWANIYTKDKDGKTPIDLADERGLKKVAKLMIDKAGEGSHYQFMQAVHSGDLFKVKAMLANHPEYLNRIMAYNMTAIIVAVDMQREDVCEYLIKKGANVNAKDVNGLTPLYLAVAHGNYKLTKILIDNGAKVNVRDYKYGLTPLQVAEMNSYQEIAKLLRKHGAR